MNKSINNYDPIAEAYLAQRSTFKNHTFLRKFTELLPKNATVLDIGCGAGVPIDEYLVKQDFLVYGLDNSKKQIELARKLVPKAAFEVKDMRQLKKSEYAVDGVVSFYAIFHIPRIHHFTLLETIRSFLNPGGMLMITMGNNDWEGSEMFHGAEMHWSQFGPTKNTAMVKAAGFEIILDELDTAGGEKHQIIIARAI